MFANLKQKREDIVSAIGIIIKNFCLASDTNLHCFAPPTSHVLQREDSEIPQFRILKYQLHLTFNLLGLIAVLENINSLKYSLL